MELKNEKLSVVVLPEKNEKSDEKKSFWHINREMLPYKLHFILFIGGAGAVFPFQSAFGITILGLTASNLAACYTALQVSIFVLKPGIGYIADYFNRLKAIIVGLAVIQTVSFLCMLMIPNTGMPGIHSIKFTETSQNDTYCQICLNLDAIKLLAPKRYFNEESFHKVSLCLKSKAMEINSIKCSAKYLNNNRTYSEDDNFQIKQMTCNSSHSNDSLLPKNRAISEDLHAKEDFFDILYINNFQKSSVCFFPTGKTFSNTNFSSDELNQNCYSLLNESNFNLQQLLIGSNFTTMNCNSMLKNASVQQKDDYFIGIENFKTYQFWLFVVCLIISCTCGSAEFTMSDTFCYESIQGNDYGQQRAWGAISWGLMAPFAGYLNDYTGSYITSWCIYAGFTVLQIWNLSRMNLVKPDFSQSILKHLKTVLSSLDFLCFTTGVFMNGLFTAAIWYYLTWFIVLIGGNKFIIGMAHTMQCFLGEVPAMFFSGWLIKKLGHFNIVSLALISHGIRFFLYSYLHNAWWILPIESLHGLTFGSFYAAMTSYAKLNSKPGSEATTQSILCTTFEALGCGTGCMVIGICLECYGGHRTFYYASFFCILATLINVLFTIILRCRKGSQVVTKPVTSTERY